MRNVETRQNRQSAILSWIIKKMKNSIDITFDFRTDTPNFPKNDPDAKSPMLLKYHKLLWNKPLPSNRGVFELDDTNPNAYLHHQSSLGEQFLTSDTLNQSYKSPGHNFSSIRDQIPESEMESFRKLVYSIGNMILFPGRRRKRVVSDKQETKWCQTINQARGCDPKIKDRFDLTLECIRRYYQNKEQQNPLAETLNIYSDFFDLFKDFRGYIDFFLLNDLVANNYSSIKFFLPFADFDSQSPYPKDVDAFRAYIEESTRFINARNCRILEFAKTIN